MHADDSILDECCGLEVTVVPGTWVMLLEDDCNSMIVSEHSESITLSVACPMMVSSRSNSTPWMGCSAACRATLLAMLCMESGPVGLLGIAQPKENEEKQLMYKLYSPQRWPQGS